VRNIGKFATGTSSSRKRKIDDDSHSSHGADDVNLTISKIEKKYLTPTKAAGSDSDNDDANK